MKSRSRTKVKGRTTVEIPVVGEGLETMALSVPGLAHLAEDSHKFAALISQQQLQELWSSTPEHAIKQREGPKGKMLAYVSHGYVEFKLNKAFGGDWDFAPVVAFNGSVFHLQQIEVPDGRGKTTVNYSVSVMGELTVRVRNPKTLEVVSTITKREFGSATWYPANEFGDSLKSALSDALKRCGLRLGIALDLYYDDERAQQERKEMDEASRDLAERIRSAKAAAHPDNIANLIKRAKDDYGKGLSELLVLLYGKGTTIAAGMPLLTKDFSRDSKVLWERVKDVCLPEFPYPVTNSTETIIEGEATLVPQLTQAEVLRQIEET